MGAMPTARLSDFLDAFADPRPIGVAVSGGSDSLGLLAMLHAAAAPGRLVALTVDHGLRPGSADEAAAVAGFCRARDIAHETLSWDGPKPASGIQAAARAARLALLADAARRRGLSAVATAHTADDQSETIAMRARRSADPGGPGLAGIPPATLVGGDVWFVRPLLATTRAEIRAWLRKEGLGWMDDPSNEDERFERVRLRKAGTGISANPAIVAERVARAEETAGLLIDRAAATGLNDFAFDGRGLAPALQAACLEALIDVCGGRARAMDRHGRARLLEFIASGGRVALGRAEIVNTASRFTLRRERRGLSPAVIAPGESTVWDGRFRVSNLAPEAPLLVTAGGPRSTDPELRRGDGVAARAFAATQGAAGRFTIEPVLGRAGRILPVFELPVANALARLTGRPEFPACPWGRWAKGMAA